MNGWDYLARRKKLALDYRFRRAQLSLSTNGGASKDRQKFWAFAALLASILGLGAIAVYVAAVEKDGTTTDPTVLQAKLAILQLAMGGLIGGFGAACQAFFRTSQTDQDNAAAMKSMADSLPNAPKLEGGGTTTTTTIVEPAPAPPPQPVPAPQPVIVVNSKDAPAQVEQVPSDEPESPEKPEPPAPAEEEK